MPACCPICLTDVAVPCPANDNDPEKRIVFVASDWELLRIAHFHRIAVAAASVPLSRRKFMVWLETVIFGFVEVGGVIVLPDGQVFATPDTLIDDTFRDPKGRWISYLRGFAAEPPRQKPQHRVLDRLRLIDLAFRIKRDEAKRCPRRR